MSAATTNTSTQDGDSYPLATHLTLTSFTLPRLPPQVAHLRSLTLTSAIPPQEDQSAHLQSETFDTQPWSSLPKSITHLTLELFSSGFPGIFLTELAKAVPNLQSLTLISCLVDGLSDASRHDALEFFNNIQISLKELHIVDSFASVGFWREVGTSFSRLSTRNAEAGLRVLEVSYTYRGHSESDFPNRISGDEWPAFLTNNLRDLSLSFAPPATGNDTRMPTEADNDQQLLRSQDGIVPFSNNGCASHALRKQFEGASGFKGPAGMSLKKLNLSMFALRPHEIGEVVYAIARTDDRERSLVDLTVSVLLEHNWLEILREGLEYARAGSGIRSLEIIGVARPGSDDLSEEDAKKLLVNDEDDLRQFRSKCPNLQSFTMSILESTRIGNVIWKKSGDRWNLQQTSRGP